MTETRRYCLFSDVSISLSLYDHFIIDLLVNYKCKCVTGALNDSVGKLLELKLTAWENQVSVLSRGHGPSCNSIYLYMQSLPPHWYYVKVMESQIIN